MILQLSKAAELEILAAQNYLDAQSRDLGDRFLDELRQTFHAITDQPESFPKLETLPDNKPYRRAILSIFSYAVVFEIIDETVLVVAVPHTSRKPNYWLG